MEWLMVSAAGSAVLSLMTSSEPSKLDTDTVAVFGSTASASGRSAVARCCRRAASGSLRRRSPRRSPAARTRFWESRLAAGTAARDDAQVVVVIAAGAHLFAKVRTACCGWCPDRGKRSSTETGARCTRSGILLGIFSSETIKQ